MGRGELKPAGLSIDLMIYLGSIEAIRQLISYPIADFALASIACFCFPRGISTSWPKTSASN